MLAITYIQPYFHSEHFSCVLFVLLLSSLCSVVPAAASVRCLCPPIRAGSHNGCFDSCDTLLWNVLPVTGETGKLEMCVFKCVCKSDTFSRSVTEQWLPSSEVHAPESCLVL